MDVDNEVNEAALKCLKQEDLHRMNLSLGGRRILEQHLRQLQVYYMYMHTCAVLNSMLYIMHTDLFAAWSIAGLYTLNEIYIPVVGQHTCETSDSGPSEKGTLYYKPFLYRGWFMGPENSIFL